MYQIRGTRSEHPSPMIGGESVRQSSMTDSQTERSDSRQVMNNIQQLRGMDQRPGPVILITSLPRTYVQITIRTYVCSL